MAAHHHARSGAPALSGERGTTLVELLLYLMIAGLLVSAISAALVVGFRTTGETTVRLAASHNAEIVTNYFPRDVASAAPSGITTAAVPTGCSSADAGSNVVLLPAASGPGDDAQVVAYRLDGGAGALTRTECSVGGAAKTLPVATGVSTATATVEPGSDGRTGVTLVVTLREPAGHRFEVTGHSRTPTAPAELPDASVPTTAPPLPCKVDSATATPSPVAIASGTDLTTDVAVAVSVSGSCVAPLTVSFTPGSSGSPTVVPLSATGATYTGTLAKTAYPWTAGTKTLTIGHAGPAPVLATLPLVVTPPCVISSPTASPGTVGRVPGNPNKDHLLSPVNVTVTATGGCADLTIRYKPTNKDVSQPMTPSGSTWTATIPANGAASAPANGNVSAEKWNASIHPIEIMLGTTLVATVDLKVT